MDNFNEDMEEKEGEREQEVVTTHLVFTTAPRAIPHYHEAVLALVRNLSNTRNISKIPPISFSLFNRPSAV